MPMTQADIHSYYATHWQDVRERQGEEGAGALRYSSRIQDEVMYPVYERLIRALGLSVDHGSILDIGCGSGRWIRFFLDRYKPARILGIDFAPSSIELLRAETAGGAGSSGGSGSGGSGGSIEFQTDDITDPTLDLGEQFDVINVGNVLFHIPEHDKYRSALNTLFRHVAPDGHIVTTEYLPRTSMRTEWMLVRSRYEFEALCAEAGLEIVDIRAATFFSDEPVGLDGPDSGSRRHFQQVRAATTQLLGAANEQTRDFLVNMFAEIDRACLAFCAERVADIDLPAQKLVVLRRAGN